MKSIYFRNFLATSVLVLSCFIIVGCSFFFIGRNFLVEQARESMAENADEVVRAVSALSRQENLNSWGLRITISSIASSTDKHIFICDEDGYVQSCSDLTLNCSHIGSKLDDSIMKSLDATGGFDTRSTLGSFYPDSRFVVAKSITSGDETVGYVFVSVDDIRIMGDWTAFLWVTLSIAVIVIIIALITSLLFSKGMAKPLDDMALAARKFAHGDFSVRVANSHGTENEMGALIDAFNNMAESLENSESQRQEFIANVSHELRTPMTTIAGFADGILDGTIPPEQEKKYLQKISDETRRLSRLVRNMLDLSQTESLAVDKSKRSKFDLCELVLKTLLNFEARATQKRLDVDPQLPEDPILVFAERDLITQVLYNLIDNAVKFASPGSVITLRVFKRDNKAFFYVRNLGETIPPDDLPYIFDRFHKSDRSRSLDKDGVGLGLYLVKTILNSHDEDIVATSRDGATEFIFTLTLA